jgi:hypothetical protein
VHVSAPELHNHTKIYERIENYTHKSISNNIM